MNADGRGSDQDWLAAVANDFSLGLGESQHDDLWELIRVDPRQSAAPFRSGLDKENRPRMNADGRGSDQDWLAAVANDFSLGLGESQHDDLWELIRVDPRPLSLLFEIDDAMSSYEVPQPILNSPFDPPAEHWHIVEGEPPERRPGRRKAVYFYRDPKAKDAQGQVTGIPVALELVNLIRERVDAWRDAGYPGVTRTTLELLQWWTRH